MMGREVMPIVCFTKKHHVPQSLAAPRIILTFMIEVPSAASITQISLK